MILTINDSLTVGEVEDRFAECFPNLKICFYSKSHKRFEASDERYRYSAGLRIENIRKRHLNDAYEIKSWYTVARVETDLKEKFGLFAQIFRYDNNGRPVQSTVSDELTLQQQSDLSQGPLQASGTDGKHELQ